MAIEAVLSASSLGSSKTIRPTKEQPAFIARGQAAANAMAKELRAEHKRWNLPLLSWKDGKVVATKP